LATSSFLVVSSSFLTCSTSLDSAALSASVFFLLASASLYRSWICF
jgi:hypothetical protein